VNARVARVYDQTDHDGYRVLVDRLWPRGMTKQGADLDEWCKQAAPSTELRTWYAHDPELFSEFRRRYRAELKHGAQAEALAHLLDLVATKPSVTLLTAVKDPTISEAVVLAELLNRKPSKR
jgi:uncharacterized protein YeaO (DUF488 family)